MKTKLLATCLFVLSSLISGCGAGQLLVPTPTLPPTATPTQTPTTTPMPTPEPPSAPPPKQISILPIDSEYSTVCKLAESQRVSISGSLGQLPNRFTLTDGRFGLRLEVIKRETTQGNDDQITIYIKVGNGQSEMRPLPATYRDSDLQIKTTSGEFAGYLHSVTVKGTVTKFGDRCGVIVESVSLYNFVP